MTALQLNQASEINRLHDMALASANRAVDYAKQAGVLLLEVKRQLPHGEFMPWLSANVKVSERQAQRYMRSALGKVTVRALLKSDTVSGLPNWLPSAGHFSSVFFGVGDLLFVQEKADTPGYFRVAFFYGSELQWTRRGVCGEYVGLTISAMLPGAYASPGLDRLQWETRACDFDLISALIHDSALAEGSIHERA
jgi:hypothetical protein